MTRPQHPYRCLLVAIAATLLAAPAGQAAGQEEIPAAIAVFDNHDTSGESPDSAAAHAARVEGFAELIEQRLAVAGGYKVVELQCAEPPCTPGSMPAEKLVGAAREAGARVLVYGGIHKMSSLVQMGKVQAIDLEKDKLLLDQAISFRGDNDEAFARAADFVVRYIQEAGTAE